ncbi:MAG: hypothetical protein IPK82_12700 [Polyangiaceae bacterium]|nr:hypothetical protein [Polyangiaceae bacterium]
MQPEPAVTGSTAGWVHLHIQTDHPGVALVGAKTCISPCDREIDARSPARFFFRAPNMPDSERFEMSNLAGAVTARVRPGSPWLTPFGFAVLGLGLYGIASAIESFVVGAVLSNVPQTRSEADTWYMSGGVSLAVGATLIGLGAWFAKRGQTTFELIPSAAR